MVARDGAAAQAREADLAMAARAGDAITAALGASGEVDAAPLGGRLAEQQRGAARRVDLVPVVHFENLDIPFGVEPRRRLAHQMREQGDPERRSEEHTSELQSLMRISYAGFFLNNKKTMRFITIF